MDASRELEAMSMLPNSIVIYLFRDPVGRITSVFNDKASNMNWAVPKSRGIDAYSASARRDTRLLYVRSLGRVRKYFSDDRIVLADNADMSTQERLDILMNEIEVKANLIPRRNFTLIRANAANNTGSTRHTKAELSQEAIIDLRKYFYKPNKDFFAMIGKDLGWNDGVVEGNNK